MDDHESQEQDVPLEEVIAALKSRDRHVVTSATETLKTATPGVLEYLVRHAADSGKSAAHRCRILRVVRQVGGEVGPWARLELWQLTHDAPKSVRLAAGRVLRALMPEVERPGRRPRRPGRTRRPRHLTPPFGWAKLKETITERIRR